jgi:DNA mismatch repair protein MutS2
MLEKYLHTLEYPKILQRLAKYAMFSASKDLAADLKPTPYYSEAQTLQAETSQARYLLSVKPGVGVGPARDVRSLLEQARRSIMLNPLELLDVRNTLIAARELRRQVTKLEDKVPLLADIAYRLEESPGVINQISACITDTGDIKNDASPELARIRREFEITHSRLMEKLRRLIASSTYAQYLQESFITQRDGRYVIPLKSDFKGRIKGVVHDQSSSGATLFVEPMPVVEQNNALRELQLAEEEEIRRILLSLTHTVALESKFIAATVQALAELDLVFAKARYAEAIQAVAPKLYDWPANGEPPPRIALRKARHPLLDPETVVPIDLTLDEQDNLLIITGPNTGGKTVSLKTVGLMALMAQAGLHIPTAEESSLMVFDGIYADIGDEQSLEQSLSTFSSHMNNIVNILAHCTPHSLVIFDELGAGTDPIEGAALARGILNKLQAEGITTLVATHYAELKAYAYVTPRVANASMEFDLETLSPTFKLRLGLPGSSNAFAIAGRLGLDQNIIQTAEGLLSEDTKETETMLVQIKSDHEKAHMERLRLEEERAEAEYYREKVEQELAKIDQERREILNEARRQAHQEIEVARKEIEGLKRQASAAIAAAKLAAHKQPQEIAGEAVADVETALKKLEATVTPERPPSKPKAARPKKRSLKIGSQVEVPTFNAKGIVVAINQDDIEVQLGHFRTVVKRDDVRLIDTPEEEKITVQRRSGAEPGESPGLELDLRGQVSEEALHRLESYLDQAYLAGLPFVRIIHGKGSGVLRRVIREALRDQPLVASFESAGQRDGGDGVTIARLVTD